MHLNVIKKKKKGALQHDVTEGSITARCREKTVPQDGSKNMCILLFQRLNKGILNRADGGGRYRRNTEAASINHLSGIVRKYMSVLHILWEVPRENSNEGKESIHWHIRKQK